MVPREILIVNDGSPLLKMVGSLLADKGHHLSLTDSPEEALVWLGARKIKLLVMKLNGQQSHRLAVLHMVKELNPGTKLLIMGHETQLPAEIFEIEADDYVILPCRMAEIWRRLSLCLESPACPPAARREDISLHPVNQRILNNLGLMFQEMRSLITSISGGMKLLDRGLHGRVGQEVEAVLQQTFQETLALMGLTDEYVQKFQKHYCTQESPEQIYPREDIIEAQEARGEEPPCQRLTLMNRRFAPAAAPLGGEKFPENNGGAALRQGERSPGHLGPGSQGGDISNRSPRPQG